MTGLLFSINPLDHTVYKESIAICNPTKQACISADYRSVQFLRDSSTSPSTNLPCIMSAFAASSPLVLGKQGCINPARSAAFRPTCSASGPDSNQNDISRRGLIAAAVAVISAAALSKPNEALAGAFGLPSLRDMSSSSDMPSLGDSKNKFKGLNDDLQGTASDLQKKMQARKNSAIEASKSAKSSAQDVVSKGKDYLSDNMPEDKVGKKVKGAVEDAASEGSQAASDAVQDPNYDKQLKGPFEPGVDVETKQLMERSAGLTEDKRVKGVIEDALDTMKK